MPMGAGGAIQLPTLVQRFRVDTDGAIRAANASLASFHSQTTRRFSSIGNFATRGITVPLVAAFAGVAAYGVSSLIRVERGLREVNTLFGLTGAAGEANFQRLQGEVQALSNELGIAQETITGGLYQAISAGVPQDNALDFMRVASQAAVAGLTDVEVSVDGLTTIINAFGLEFDEAESVADSMFATVQGGKITFDELSSSLFQVAPSAAAAGVRFQDVNAAMAAMTASGFPASEAAVRLRASLDAVARQGAVLDPIFQGLGHTSAEAALQSEGLQYVLDAIYEAAGGTNSGLLELLGSTEAVSAVNVLAGEGSAAFSEELARQADSAGAAQVAFEEMDESTARRLERLRVRFQNLSMVLAEQLLPALNKIAEWAISAITWFEGLSPPMRRFVGVLAAVAIAFGPVLLMTARLIQAFRLVRASIVGMALIDTEAIALRAMFAWSGFTTALSGVGAMISSTILPSFYALVGAVAAPAAAFAAAAAFVAGLWVALEHTSGWIHTVIQALSFLGGPMTMAVAVVQYLMGGLTDLNRWLNVVQGAFAVFFLPVAALIGGIRLLVDHFGSLVGFFTRIPGYLSQIPGAIAAIPDALGALGGMIFDVLSGLGGFVARGLAAAFSALGDFMEPIIGPIRRALAPVAEWVGNALRPVREVLVGFIAATAPVWRAGWGVLVEAVRLAWAVVSGILQVGFEFVRTLFFIFSTTVQVAWNILWVTISNIAMIAWAIVRRIVEVGLGALSLAFQIFTSVVTTYWNFLWGAITTAAQIAWAVLGPIIQLGLNLVMTAFRFGASVIRTVWNFLWGGIAGAVRFYWPMISAIVMTGVNTVRNVISVGMGIILTVWNTAWAFIRDNILPIMTAILGGVRDAMSGIRSAVGGAVSAITSVWRGLRRVFADTVNWVIDNVINRFIGAINRVADALGLDVNLNTVSRVSTGGGESRHEGGFIGGPGSSRKGRTGPLRGDEVLVTAQKGELMLSKAQVAALDPHRRQWLANASASELSGLASGGGLAEFMTPETGGFLSDTFGDMAEWGGRVGRGILDAGRRAIAEIARPMVEGALDVLGGIPFGGAFADYAVGALRQVGDWVLDWIAGIETDLEEASSPLLIVPPRGPFGVDQGLWRTMADLVRGQFPGTSFGGFNARRTATGNLSLHGYGRATDITPPRMDIFNWIAENYGPQTYELIFSPANGRQIYRGSPHMYSGITRSMHFDHIHWGLANGGLAVGPALALIGETAGSRPEHVVPDRMLRRSIAEELAKVGSGGGAFASFGDVYGYLPGDLEREVRRALENVALGWS